MNSNILVAAATHDKSILEKNLQLSPVIQSKKIQLMVEHGAPSASVAYNRILDNANHDIIIFAHHDVYLPLGWDSLLRRRIAELDAIDPNWAILAPFGIGHDGGGFGPVWSSSLGSIVGRVATAPVPVQSVDELVIIMRRKPGLRFDETLSGFHFYGTDIVQNALKMGSSAYVMALPLIHNDGFKEQLDRSYVAAYMHQRRKWRDRLPVVSPTIKISWHSQRLIRNILMNVRSRGLRLNMAETTTEDPRKYASLCGWSDLGASAWPPAGNGLWDVTA